MLPFIHCCIQAELLGNRSRRAAQVFRLDFAYNKPEGIPTKVEWWECKYYNSVQQNHCVQYCFGAAAPGTLLTHITWHQSRRHLRVTGATKFREGFTLSFAILEIFCARASKNQCWAFRASSGILWALIFETCS